MTDVETEIAAVKSANDNIVTVDKSLEKVLAKSEKFQTAALELFQHLEEPLEDETNRQLRQTIAVMGLQGNSNEKAGTTSVGRIRWIIKKPAL